jgi:AcrR family transcriptional regulator
MSIGGFPPEVDPLSPGSQAEPLDGDTQERLLEATDRLVRQIGFGKTSMADVARSAGVARGTLYRYFESREALFDALLRRTTDQFFAEAAAEMDRGQSLSEQLGVFSEMMIRWIRPETSSVSSNPTAMVKMLATQGGVALQRTSAFLRPYLEAARERGEVREDLDVVDASEWLARILLSFTIFQASISFEAGDPHSVGEFVRRYAIDGLTGDGGTR